ncbi:hypothetical protein BgAZ_108350 [Babesia gibsoni]|uniref:Uncharacterized protein n=1 Tax=Babesia gibsoni TaxID=33632 RepID=A0AAD8UWF9_BABGI|nr:hypothetical protein BgAZ_108350 [Babesia gibsoni]
MDVLDFITSRKVLVSNISDESSPHVDSGGNLSNRDYEARWKDLKKVIRTENAKKKPCVATLKKATEELKELRRLLLAGDECKKRKTIISCLDNASQNADVSEATDWSKAPALRKRNASKRRFVFYMPVGNEVGTDVSIGRERLENIHKKVNKNVYGPMDTGPTIAIAGVPQPMDRMKTRHRRK